MMSRAFVKESDGAEDLPERPVSGARNLVTRRGLALIERAVATWREALAAAAAAGDRASTARASRELRYWTQRRATAEPVDPPPDGREATFGAAVTVAAPDGRRRTYRIVGEDEADPAAGRLAWVAPVARGLVGASVGDEVMLPSGPVEVVAIDSTPEPA
jgi:transcription elongation GreA/GreB family factor